jgi:hypothetical protein
MVLDRRVCMLVKCLVCFGTEEMEEAQKDQAQLTKSKTIPLRRVRALGLRENRRSTRKCLGAVTPTHSVVLAYNFIAMNIFFWSDWSCSRGRLVLQLLLSLKL